jgi:hypothetical protein
LLSGEGFSSEHFFLQRSSDLADFLNVFTMHNMVFCGYVEYRQNKTNSDLADFLYVISLDHLVLSRSAEHRGREQLYREHSSSKGKYCRTPPEQPPAEMVLRRRAPEVYFHHA